MTENRVLITNAASGLGLATASAFLAAGWRVACHVNSSQAGASLGQNAAIAVTGDLSGADACSALVAEAASKLGGLDCLVNHAIFNPSVRSMDVTESLWDQSLAINLRSAMFCTKAALPLLRNSKGSIVMISSVAALLAGPPDRLLYSIAKAGLLGMARSLSIELASDHVRVNSVAPGFIDTPELHADDRESRGQIGRSVAASVPMGRLGTPGECAAAIVFLASAAASYCNGAVLGVDGGSAANASWGTRT